MRDRACIILEVGIGCMLSYSLTLTKTGMLGTWPAVVAPQRRFRERH